MEEHKIDLKDYKEVYFEWKPNAGVVVSEDGLICGGTSQ